MPPLRAVVRSLLAFALIAEPTTAQPMPRRFAIDASHSSVGFAVRFSGLSTVRGAFANLDGTIMYVDRDPARSSVYVIIDAASINTNSATRDKHLKSPDFFEVERYPTITFRSTKITPTKKGFVARGSFTMHGVTKELDIPFVQLIPPVLDGWGNTRVTFQGGLRLNRDDYGIKGTAFWNDEFDPGRLMVAKNVDVELLVSANIANPMRWAHPVGDSILSRVETDGLTASIGALNAAHAARGIADSIPAFAFLLVGEKLSAKGRLSDAIAFYEAVIALRPSALGVRIRLGEAYVKAGRLADARAEFEKVAQQLPAETASAEWLRSLPAKK